jgi:Tol biopolymer transport system component
MESTIRVNLAFFCIGIFLFIGVMLAPEPAFALRHRSNGKIAFTSDRDGNREIYVMNADGTDQRRLTNNPGVDDYPAWSPDGKRIAFLSQDQTGGYSIKLMNADGTGSSSLTTTTVDQYFCINSGFACGLSWSPDGNRIAFTDGSDIVVINSDGTGRINLTNTPSPIYEINPSWSPDGSEIVFTYSNSFPYIYSSAFVMDSNGANIRPWSGTGNAGNLGDKDPAWAPNGTQAAVILNRYPVDSSDLCILNANGGRTRLDFVIERDHASPTWSPDGEFLAFESTIDPYKQYTNHEIVVIKADGSGVRQLTNTPGYDGHPSWQPIAAASHDFDGDGKTDLSVFRPEGPSGAEWWYRRSSNGTVLGQQFGISTDKPVAADFTGDGKTDVAVWRPSSGQWFIIRSEDGSFYAFPFGTNGDIPVPADYDGDGKADPAVFRPSTGQWFIQKTSGGTDFIPFGKSSDVPVTGDFDGDGKADIAIFRPSGASPGAAEWWIRRSSGAGVLAFQFGISTDKAVPGDYTGDGKTDVAIYRGGSPATWYVLRSEDFSFFSFPFGTTGDIPVPGNYDGDAKWDAGVFRPSNKTWFVNQTGGGTLIIPFGVSTDVPVPSTQVGN